MLSELLTVIITTSPTPSAPATELLASVIDSFRAHSEGLLRCPVIIVFDAYERVAEIDRLKKGQVTHELAKNYERYKHNVKHLVLTEWKRLQKELTTVYTDEAEYGSRGCESNSVSFTISRTADGKITFLEPRQRLGFGLAVRSALRAVETSYVWVHQHDWALLADIPLSLMLDVMQNSSNEVPIKYICLPSVRMLSYAKQTAVKQFPVLRSLTDHLKGDFTSEAVANTSLPLTPLFFWHDKPHIASTAHYLARIFPTRLAIQRGDFIEDSIGQRARTQMKDGQWHKWACWLYYPADGTQLCLKHLDGRVWRGAAGELKQKRMWIERMTGATGVILADADTITTAVSV